MDPVRRAVEVLQNAEGGLRLLMQDEIAAGRYTQLPILASLADGVSALVDKAGAADPDLVANSPVSPRMDKSSKSDAGQRASRPPVSSKSKKYSAKYPHFEVGDECIGKVGWSKKNREEYRHHAPLSAALELARHVDETQERGRVWTVEDLGEVLDPDAGGALPSYQLYLVIAWMRSVGLLAKQGRSGYVAVGGGKLLPQVEKKLGLE